METGDLEQLADAVYRHANLDGETPATPLKLARRLFGPDGVTYVPSLREMAALATVNGEPRIAVRRSLSPAMRAFAIGHELGHWIMKREGCANDGETERACDFISAALIVPRRAYRTALGFHGQDWTQLALDFRTTESMCALRAGEVTGTPLALVAPLTVRVRGSAFAWPETEDQIRRLAKLPALPGMRRARLKDDPRRVVLEAEELFDAVG